VLRLLLGEAQRGERLAGATRHDEFATVGLSEVLHGIGDSSLLMGADGFFDALGGTAVHIGIELEPINRGVDEVGQIDSGDGGILVFDGLGGVARPVNW
jgi:hypothetical protein